MDQDVDRDWAGAIVATTLLTPREMQVQGQSSGDPPEVPGYSGGAPITALGTRVQGQGSGDPQGDRDAEAGLR